MLRAQVRPFTADDLRGLVGRVAVDDLAHHRERLSWQTEDRALYLVAWADDVVVGRATLLWQSKYPEVRHGVPGCCEVNALEASPTGAGVGRSLMLAAEGAVQARALPLLGVAVEPSNNRARRFYERLGYVEWGRGPVCDEWDECDAEGVLVRHHADRCDYLIKAMQDRVVQDQ